MACAAAAWRFAQVWHITRIPLGVRGRIVGALVSLPRKVAQGFPQWRISIGPINLDYGLLVEMLSEKLARVHLSVDGD